MKILVVNPFAETEFYDLQLGANGEPAGVSAGLDLSISVICTDRSAPKMLWWHL